MEVRVQKELATTFNLMFELMLIVLPLQSLFKLQQPSSYGLFDKNYMRT